MAIDRTIQKLIDDLQSQLDTITKQIKVRNGPTQAAGNYNNPADAFGSYSGTFEAHHFNLAGIFSVGPNGSVQFMPADSTYGAPIPPIFTNNSPVGGQVAWTAVTVEYQGQQFTIVPGLSGNAWIYWQKSNPSIFQSSSAVPALGADDFVVCFNNGGFAWPAFNFIINDGTQRVIMTGAEVFILGGTNTGLTISSDVNGNGVIALFSSGGATQSLAFQGSAIQTTATAGTNGATPAQVAGYWSGIRIGGTTYKVPLYNV